MTLNDEQLDALRVKHGDIRVLELDGDAEEPLQVVLRKPVGSLDPKRDEFLSFATKRSAMEQAPAQVRDPEDTGLRELLVCVVSANEMELRQHLDSYPVDASDLFSALTALAGYYAVKDAPELVTEEARSKFHRRAFGVQAGTWSSLVRPLTGAEYARFVQRNGGTLLPLRAEALAWAAWSCVQEMPDKDKHKPGFEQALRDTPFVAVFIGYALVGLAGSRVREREKK